MRKHGAKWFMGNGREMRSIKVESSPPWQQIVVNLLLVGGGGSYVQCVAPSTSRQTTTLALHAY